MSGRDQIYEDKQSKFLHCGNEEECRREFLLEMQECYTGLEQSYAPESIQDIDVCDIHVCLSIRQELLWIKVVKAANKNTISLKSLNYSTNGGFHSGFTAILLPQGEMINVGTIF